MLAFTRLFGNLSPSQSESLEKGTVYITGIPGDLSVFSEDHLRFLAESLPEIVWTALPDGTVDFMNRRWFAYTGLTEAETYGEQKTSVHPDDFPLYKARWKQAIQTGQPYEMAYRFRRASDATYRWHIGRAMPLRDSAGRIIKWFGTCVDIHGQKEAEEKIRTLNEELETTVLERTKHLRKEIRQRRRAEEKYLAHLQLLHSMIDMFPMAAGVVDTRGYLLHANERLYSLFHLSKETAGLEFFSLPHVLPRAFPTHIDECLAALKRGDAFKAELTRGDGRIFMLEYIPAMDDALEHGYLLLLRDISQEKKIDRAKSEFMALASHQLRTPLTSMRWALGRLARRLQGKVSQDEFELLQRARASTLSMAQTVTRMLSISRIEAGLHTVSNSEFDLGEFFTEIAEDFKDSMEAGRLTFTVDAPSELRVSTDHVMLKEIVANLLANAAKYTPAGGTVSLTAEKEGDRVLIRVRDTGLGIPSHQHQRVFGKFFRGENIMQIDTQGTGLGLYLVSQLVDVIGASIEFESEERKGTTFTLALPLHVALEPEGIGPL